MGVRTRRRRAAAGVAAGGLLLAGLLVARELSSPVFGLRQGPLAKDAACTRIADRYPDRLDGDRRDRVTFEGLAVWGHGAVRLRCGLTPPVPTKDPCFSVNGVDWVLREAASRDGRKLVVTYGRRPAVELSIADSVRQPDAVLTEVSRLVAPVRQNDHCLRSG
ncbi:Protein of unknown function [Streptomyces sp. 1222.5]|uniref:DUF3515 family protein n=1 Tax=unclassified Streptomyces TaxID=2593676 RepID=UPI00089A1B60|nr:MULTISPECIES: DUF3515 family protein [unclassified Streptomyces]PKW08420.1 uncharacterized protein DUF3515 [Streptomyces sp. 5112.2]SEC63621.1 Protein of unknown function [Streptomyces sp. 1222.5]